MPAEKPKAPEEGVSKEELGALWDIPPEEPKEPKKKKTNEEEKPHGEF